MTKKYTRKLIVDRIRKQRTSDKKSEGSHNKTYRKNGHRGGAEPDNFFTGKTLTIDQFLDANCYPFSKNSVDGNSFLRTPEYLVELIEKTTKLPKNADKEGTPYEPLNNERVANLMKVFSSNDKFYQCIRTLTQVDMFTQDVFDDYLKLQVQIKKTRGELQKADLPDGASVDDIFNNLKDLTRLLGRSTLVYWINKNMNSRTRVSNRENIRDIFRRLKPEYYFFIMFAREPVSGIMSSIMSRDKNKLKYLISHNNRIYIYELMQEIYKVSTPEDLHKIMFDTETLVQMNGDNNFTYDTAINMLNNYINCEYSSFGSSNKWNIQIEYPSRSIMSYASDLSEVNGKYAGEERTKYKPSGSVMSLNALQTLISAFRGEVIERGGFDITLLTGNKNTNNYTNGSGDQKVYYRHQKLDGLNPDITNIYIPEGSPYKGSYQDPDFEFTRDDEKSKDEYMSNKKNINMGLILYKHFIYAVASKMKTEPLIDEQLGGETVQNAQNVKVPDTLELSKDNNSLPEQNETIPTAVSIPVPENKKPLLLKDKAEDYVFYEWTEIYSRVKKSINEEGMSKEDAFFKEYKLIEDKLNDVYPWFTEKFADVPDAEEKDKKLTEQDNAYFKKYGEFLKIYMVLHGKHMNPAIIEGSSMLTTMNSENMVLGVNTLKDRGQGVPEYSKEDDTFKTGFFNYQGEKDEKFPMTPMGFQGLFYKFISINELETFDFNEISGEKETLNLFTTPEELEKPEEPQDNTSTQVVQLGGDAYIQDIIPRITTTQPDHKIEKGGLEKLSDKLNKLPEPTEKNPYIKEYTKDNFMELVSMFENNFTNVISGFLYQQNTSGQAYSHIYNLDEERKDAFFAYRTKDEVDAKIEATGNSIEFSKGQGVNAYETMITDKQLDEVIDFMDKKTSGLIKSTAMKPYLDVLKTNIKLKKKVLFANPEKGYIYTFGSNDILLGHSRGGQTLPRLIVGTYYNFEGIDNAYSNRDVTQSHIVLWHNPPSAMRQYIMLSSPRIYHAVLKPIWNTIDGKDTIEVVAEPVSEEPPVTATQEEPSEPVSEPQEMNAGVSEELPIVEESDKKEVKELSQEKTKLDKDINPPRSITINVTTTIPGHQEFKLEPSDLGIDMGKGGRGKNNKRKTALVNPQLKLSEKAIKLAGDDNIKRQFYDGQLFLSLNNRIASEFMLGTTPIPFDVAIEKGIVDYNIDLTVKTILQKNSIIYLAGKPYTIYSVDFDDNSWKLEPKDQIDMRLNMRDIADANILNMQSKRGAEELRKIPDSLKRGDGNSEPIPLKQRNPEDVKKEEEKKKFLDEDKEEEKKEDVPRPPEVININGKVLVKKEYPAPTPPPSTEIIVKRKPIVIPPKIEKNLPELPAPPTVQTLPGIATIPVPDKNDKFQQPNVNNNNLISKMMRKFFDRGYYIEYTQQNVKTGDYKNLPIDYKKGKGLLTNEQLNEIVANCNYFNLIKMMNDVVQGEDKGIGRQLFKSDIYKNIFNLGVNMGTTNKGLGKVFNCQNYIKYLEKLQIIEIDGDGNCFYNCVATAFNMQNAYVKLMSDNDGSKPELITYDDIDLSSQSPVTRSNTEFTPMFIRWAVVNYYRGHKHFLLFDMIVSSSLVYGYDATMKWVTSNKEYTDLIEKNKNLKDYMDYLEQSREIIENNSLYFVYKEEAEYLLENKDLSDEERKMSLFQTADSMFRQSSNDAKFIVFNKEFDKEPSVKDYQPFSTPTTFDEAEKLLMRSSYYAQMSDIEIIQQIFKVKVIALKRMMNTTIIEPKSGIETDPKLRRREIGFRVANDIKDDTVYNIEKPVKYDKVIVVSYEDDNHYNLIVFNATMSQAEKNAVKTVSSKNITRKGGMYKASHKKRTRKNISGGAVTSMGNYKKAVFPLYDVEKDFLTKLEASQNMSLPQLDNLELSMPFYMYILTYTSYNMIKDRNEDDIYKSFGSFYSYFKIFDSIIEDVIRNQTNRLTFTELYTKVFNVDRFNMDYFENERVEELSDKESVVEVSSESDNDTSKEEDNLEDDDQLGGFRQNGFNPPVITRDTIDLLNEDKSNLTFQVNVHLTLKEGEGIDKSDVPSLACEARLQAIKMNWAKILGRQYFPTPRKVKDDKNKDTK